MTNIPVFDGHNDTLLDIHLDRRDTGRTFFDRSEHGHIDLPRAREGGFGGGIFAIFVPPEEERPDSIVKRTEAGYEWPPSPPIDTDYATRLTDAVIARMEGILEASNGAVELVRDAVQLQRCLDSGVLAMILHFEGAEALGTDLDMLDRYYDRGLRSLGLVWSRPNAFADGVPFCFPASPDTGDGLTPLGFDLVKRCDELGVAIDLSHLNEKGFWDVQKSSRNPLIASHSNAHALCASTRNLTDEQLDAIGDSNGLVGINYAVPFLREDGKRIPETPLTDIVRHATYIAERIGIDKVGLGSDFDGAEVSSELGDVTGLPKLLDEFRAAGYGDDDLRKICHENWVRVLTTVWQ
ncbi:MAG: dipeptidase [Planctomycetota bacterium]